MRVLYYMSGTLTATGAWNSWHHVASGPQGWPILLILGIVIGVVSAVYEESQKGK